jgi:hypothetical protein
LNGFNQISKGLRILDRYIRENFAIEKQTFKFQVMHKERIVESVQSAGGVYANNPEPSEVALAISAVAIGIFQAFLHCLTGGAIEAMPAADVAFSQFEDFFVSVMSRGSVSCSGHILKHSCN